MDANRSHGESLESLFLDVLESTGSKVCVLYRKNAMGGYAPVFWLPHEQEPAHVASASDLASLLRTMREQFSEMDLTAIKDRHVRCSMESYGITTIACVPLKGDQLKDRYFLSPGKCCHYLPSERENLICCAERLSSSLEQATLSARIRSAALAGDDSLDAYATLPFKDKSQRYSLLSLAVKGGSFQELADSAREVLDIPGCRVTIEDSNGLLLAEDPDDVDRTSASHWLSGFPRLSYLDLMEDYRRAVYAPFSSNTFDSGMLVMPLFGRKNLYGLVSVYPVSRDDVLVHNGVLDELCFAALYLMHRREASRSHILRRSLDSVENERARIAVELHNETSQNLVALKVRLATARRVLAKGLTEDALGILEDCSCISDEILSGVNRLATDLRPSELAYLGLCQAIEAAAEARLSRKSISFSVIGNATDVHFSALQESMLLSGVIEALSNCAQHSHASHVEVEMHDDGSWFTVSVRDDGQGFDTGLSEGTGYGLKSMSDSASAIGGYFWIGSTPGVGTNVRFSVPTMYLEEDDGE